MLPRIFADYAIVNLLSRLSCLIRCNWPLRNDRSTHALVMEIMLTTSRRTFTDINTEEDLIPPGAKPGTIPTDVDHATGIERLELIGKMQGIDIFDMRPLDASRKGMFRPRFLIRVVYNSMGC